MSERVIEAGGAPFARVRAGEGPVVAVALHAGHELRPGLVEHIALPEDERLREEDPHTAQMAPEGCPLVEVLRSRFEVDCNRPRFRAVYQGPKDAWGLSVYADELPDAEDRVSRAVYDAFYAAMFDELSRVSKRFGRFLVLDLHSYNHRRDGFEAPPAPSADNPEVNVGTAHIDRVRWAPVVDLFCAEMTVRGFEVGENVKFGGGHLAHWVSEEFAETGCTLAIEFKKTYIDEWTGVVDVAHVSRIRSALTRLADPLRRAMDQVR